MKTPLSWLRIFLALFIAFTGLMILHPVYRTNRWNNSSAFNVNLPDLMINLRTSFPKSTKTCDELFRTSPLDPGSGDFWIQFKSFEKTAELVVNKTTGDRTPIEGHIGQLKKQCIAYQTLARLPFVKRICEIGFNAGHSAFIFLASNPNVSLVSFDLGRYPFTKVMAEHIQSLFPGRFNIIYGDTTKTVPEANTTLYKACDMVIVDGGHTYEVAKQDLVNMRSLANPKHNLVVFDDYPVPDKPVANKQLQRAWHESIQQGLLVNIFGCSFTSHNSIRNKRGFSLGMYIF